jgi:serine/threonine-protein kinase
MPGRRHHLQRELPKVNAGPRYRVIDEIAQGGMGTVFLAVQATPSGTVPVAIKKVNAHLVDNDGVVASLIDEARIASRIDHPNVVSIQTVEVIGDEIVIVMRYVEGVALQDILHPKETPTALPIPVVRRILVDALQGLHAAHELTDDAGAPLGVVHRDVSPHNLLVDADGVTRVTDFGIAVAAGRIAETKPGAVKGKLRYLSPEQVLCKPVDRRADVFAAGAVAWEMISGRRLFEGNEGETLAKIVRDPIMPPSTHRFDVPLDLDEACLRALEREPQQRFATALDFARAIEEGGPLASREEVGALVLAEAAPVFASRRQKIAKVPPRMALEPEAFVAEASRERSHAPGIAAEVPRGRSRLSGILVMLVAAALVVGGALVGMAVRAPPAPIPAPVATAVATAITSLPAVMEVPSAAPVAIATAAPVVPSATATASAPQRPAPRNTSRSRGRPFMPSDL